MTSREVLWTAAAGQARGATASDAYGWAFRNVGSIVRSPDLSIGNLEFPVRPDVPAAGCKPFNGEPAYLDALKKLGFDVLFTANNHMLDQGVRGAETTLEQLRRRDFLTLGISRAGQPWDEILHVKIGDGSKLNVAFLNYTSGISDDGVIRNVEHLLFGRNINYAFFNEDDRVTKRLFGIVAGTVFSSALLPSQDAFIARIAANAARARADGAAYLIAFMHWGKALDFYPTAAQRRLAQRICEAGIDAVLGSGPHTIQPVELMRLHSGPTRECLVAYSLGNFIGGTRGLGTHGLGLEITLARGDDGIYVQNYQPRVTRTVYHELSDVGRPVMIELQPDTLEEFVRHLPQRSGQAAPPSAPVAGTGHSPR